MAFSELGDVESEERAAWEAYPSVAMLGPVFGCAVQVEPLVWRLLSGVHDDTPQSARDTLRSRLPQRGTDEQDANASKEYIGAALKLDWERHDELMVAGQRFRIVRGDRFVCFGPQGPEPPRPTDPDPADEGWHHPSVDEGRLIHAVVPTGRLAILLGQGCIPLIPAAGGVPDDVYRDARRVAETHGGFMLLSVRFMVAEQVGQSWESRSGDCRTLQQARPVLAQQLRRYGGEGGDKRDLEAFAAYEQAAQVLERDRGNEVVVRGRRFCIARIETVVYFTADGPEMPRPSDYDPYPPPELHAQQLREAGQLVDTPEGEA
ncbi:DUF5954 family protein [Nonomuraea sp. CA-143628]|uniref:DUF5954 family protein n=1 Tax=Nonomuraea sp. CA-143628 TaxID=3239997 RepID=UPI003D8C6502